MNKDTSIESNTNRFNELYAINVNDNAEKKGKLTYLSWSWAVAEVMKKDPLANWSFREPITYKDGTMMVHCDVTVFGKTMYMFLPVMDYRNEAIQNPNATAINKAMMRCLTKGFAVHGLGLYIYAGEDLPEEEKIQLQTNRNQQSIHNQDPLHTEYRKALSDIQNLKSKEDFKPIWGFFKTTNYADDIASQFKAKCDQMGWETREHKICVA